MPEVMVDMVREQFESDMELWATNEKRELQGRLDTHQVMEAAAHIVKHTLEAELKIKLGETEIKGLLTDFWKNIHLAKVNRRFSYSSSL